MQTGNWDDYRFILAVVELGSLNAAARALGVNHATVLRRIKGFEDRFGIEVFHRSANGYRVIADPVALSDSLHSMREAMEAAERVLMGQSVGMRGPIKITSTDSLCDQVLPQIVAQLAAEHPELSLSLLATNTRVNLAELEAEISVRPAPRLPDELIGTEVCGLGMGCYQAKGLSGPAAERWLGQVSHIARSPAAAWMEDNVAPDRIVSAADSFVTLRGLCLNGLGKAILPHCLGQGCDGLESVEGPELSTRIWVAHHRDLDRVARVARTHEVLVEMLREKRAVLEGGGLQ